MPKKRTDLASIAFTWMLGLLGLSRLQLVCVDARQRRAAGTTTPRAGAER